MGTYVEGEYNVSNTSYRNFSEFVKRVMVNELFFPRHIYINMHVCTYVHVRTYVASYDFNH